MNKFLKKIKEKLKNTLLIVLFIVISTGMFFLIGFAQINQNEKKCTGISIRIGSDYNNYFVDKQMVMDIITNNGKNPLTGKIKKELPVTKIEKKLKQNPFIDKAEVFCDLNGNMNVTVSQKKPVARIITSSGTSYYLDNKGDLLPLSGKYTARVLVVTGKQADVEVRRYQKNNFRKNFLKPDGKQFSDSSVFSGPVMELMQFIISDKFWNMQIAQINIHSLTNVDLIPVVGDQIIELGEPDGYEKKFQYLMAFYRQAMPETGWNLYNSISLKYKNQIVCRR